MLAQGQSSSAKRGGLAVVSSGLIFLKTKKKKEDCLLSTIHRPYIYDLESSSKMLEFREVDNHRGLCKCIKIIGHAL